MMTKKLSVKDCKGLIDRVRNRVNDWRNRVLSYAGRLQLIASVLASMQVFWSSVFLLPKTVIKDINKILRNFLWSHGDLTKGKAKIVWEHVCKPKDQSGLGIRDLQKWNEILLTKHLWNVAAKKDSLWVKWIHVEKLKGRSFLGVSLNKECEDKIWINSAGKRSKFSVSIVWKDLQSMGQKVNWKGLAWFSQCIPKHSFVFWMAVQGKLITQDKVSKWKPNEIMSYALCGTVADSHDHLFFKCQYAKRVWDELQVLMKKKCNGDWTGIILEFSNLPSNKNIWSIVRKLGCQAAVYYIWQERNGRMFRNKKRDETELIKIICETIKCRLMSIKTKDTEAVKQVERRWSIVFSKLYKVLRSIK
ncbi:reverse transcriptase domain, reverse transcriptase zinc-binding domain protein [Tanacetum coccineum]